jgi:hypothetical protein
MRQLDEYKRNVTASLAANIMALFRFTGIHVCTKQSYTLKVPFTISCPLLEQRALVQKWSENKQSRSPTT